MVPAYRYRGLPDLATRLSMDMGMIFCNYISCGGLSKEDERIMINKMTAEKERENTPFR